MKTIYHVTHSDLDAAGCDIIVRLYAKASGYEVITDHCYVTAASKSVFTMMNNVNHRFMKCPDIIIISDISITDRCAEELNTFVEMNHIKIIHRDHHKTCALDKKYSWSKVYSDEPFKSAARLMYDEFYDVLHDYFEVDNELFTILNNFINDVSRYDTWLWKNDPTDYSEEYYNIIFGVYGFDTFVDTIITRLLNYKPLLNESDKNIVSTNLKRRENDVKLFTETQNNIYIKVEDSQVIGFIMYYGDNMNSVMEAIYNTYPNIDIVACLLPNKRSIAFRSNKPNIDVGEYAKKKFNGGGHKSASGCDFIDIDTYTNLLNDYYHGIENNRKFGFKD